MIPDAAAFKSKPRRPMQKREITWIVVLLLLIGAYFYFFGHRGEKKEIQINVSVRPPLSRRGAAPVMLLYFALDNYYKLNSLKVIEVDSPAHQYRGAPPLASGFQDRFVAGQDFPIRPKPGHGSLPPRHAAGAAGARRKIPVGSFRRPAPWCQQDLYLPGPSRVILRQAAAQGASVMLAR